MARVWKQISVLTGAALTVLSSCQSSSSDSAFSSSAAGSPTSVSTVQTTTSGSSGSGSPVSAVSVYPAIQVFNSSSTSITVGSSVTLDWSTLNSTTVSISGGVGTVTAFGSVTVTPTTTTTYTLSATAEGGTTTKQLTITVAPFNPSAELIHSGRKKILFSLDQGFGNGIVVNNDVVSTQAIAQALAPLQSMYDVFVVVNPDVTNQANLTSILDTLAAQGIGFIFDIYSSDSSSLGACTSGYDSPVGYTSLSTPLANLSEYKTRYGNYFAGLRIFEILAQDAAYYWDVQTQSESSWACWVANVDPTPGTSDYAVFKTSTVQSIIQYAVSQKMFVQFSDWGWNFQDEGNAGIYQANIRSILQSFGGASAPVYMTYDNNVSGNAFWDTSTNSANWTLASSSAWYKWVSGMQSISGLGTATHLGLSDQTWMCANEVTCPVGNVITWAWGAFQNGAELVQFEPVWYFFNLPRGSVTEDDYTTDSAYDASLRGQPNANFIQLRQWLLTQ